MSADQELTEEYIRQLEARKWSDLLKDMAEMRADMAAHRLEVQQIKDVFEQAKGALVFVKWVSAVSAALIAFWTFAAAHVKFK